MPAKLYFSRRHDWNEDVGRGENKAEEADVVRLWRAKQGVKDLIQQGPLVGFCPEGDTVEMVFGKSNLRVV